MSPERAIDLPSACVVTKSLIVNGLNRSGTTMVGRVLGSQPGIVCIGGLFEMVRIIAEMRGFSDKGPIVCKDFTSGPNLITERSEEVLRVQLVRRFLTAVSFPLFLDYESAPNGDNNSWPYGLTPKQVFKLVEIIRTYSPIRDISGLMGSMGRHLGLRVMSAKWTHCHKYAPVFLDSPNAYWIEVVRRPYARISSGLRGGWSMTDADSLRQTEDALEFAGRFRHSRYRVLRYEDLCDDPDNVLLELSEWLGVTLKNTPLLNPLGGPFRGNTSENVVAGKPYWHQRSDQAPRVGAVNQDRWRAHLSSSDIAFINRALKTFGPYEKEAAAATLASTIEYLRLRSRLHTKRIVKAVFNCLGLSVSRKPTPRRL